MAVGRTLAGRQARKRDGEQADWQAGGQMSRQVLLTLITVQRLSESDATRGQKAALRSAARMGGGGWETGGLGSCRREVEKEEGEEKRREDHVQRGGGGVKLQLLTQERRKTLLASLSLSFCLSSRE